MTEPAFIADSKTEELAQDRVAYLDLTGASASTYYFNQENNDNYTRNWFNYTKFQQVHPRAIISEVVQYARPELIASELDTSKTYALPSTTMTASWGTRIENNELFVDPSGSAIAGQDSAGNIYVLNNYVSDALVTASTQAVVYNENDSIFGAKLPDGSDSGCVLLTKYNSSGVAQWSSRIRSTVASEKLFASYGVTDLQGTTYILITGSGGTLSGIICENALGGATLTLSATDKTYLVAYDLNGTPDWLTYCTGELIGTLAVDNLNPGHVFVMLENPTDLQIDFYDNVLVAPSLALSIPAESNVIVARYSNSGIFQWATYLSGYRVGMTQVVSAPIIAPTFTTQTLACDSDGNVVLTGYYNQLNPLVLAKTPTDPLSGFTTSTVRVPPFTSQVIWVPRDFDRQWSAVDVESTGQYMIASVKGGFLYVSTDFGSTWEARASIQDWSSVYCGLEASVLVACANPSIIYRSLDGGETWFSAGTEGSVARKWMSLAGTETGSRLVALADDDRIFFSVDYGANWILTQQLTADGSLALNAGENSLSTLILDNTEQFAFTSTNTSPSQIVKVDISSTPNPTRINALTLNAGENLVRSVARYFLGATQELFYSTDTSPGQIVQVDVATVAPTRLSATQLAVFPSSSSPYDCPGITVGLISSDGLYAYLATNVTSAPIPTYQQFLLRMDLQNPSGPVLDRALNLNLNATFGAVSGILSNTVAHINLGSSSLLTYIYRVDLNSFSVTGNLYIGVTDPGLVFTAVNDSTYSFGYFGTNSSPAKIVRVDLTTATPTRTGAVTLNAGENDLRCAVVDLTNTYAYFGTNTSPGQIIKVDITTSPNPTRVGAITLASGQNQLRCACIDTFGQYAYFGTYTNPAQIIKVDLNTFSVVDTLVLTGYLNLVGATVNFGPFGEYAYFTGMSGFSEYVIKVDLSTFDLLNSLFYPLETTDVVSELPILKSPVNPDFYHPIRKLTGGFNNLNYFMRYTETGFPFFNSAQLTNQTLLSNNIQTNLRCVAQTPTTAFYGAYTTGAASGGTDVPSSVRGASIVKFDLQNNQYLGQFTLAVDEYFLSTAIADSVGQYAYFGTDTSPGRVVKINMNGLLNDPSGATPRVGAITFLSGENNITCSVIDPTNSFAYFGLNTTPGIVVKVNLATFTRVGSIQLEPGENGLSVAAIDATGAYAYFGTNTSPGRIVAISLASFSRIYSVTLGVGENLLSTGLYSTVQDCIIVGTNTTPGNVVRLINTFTAPIANWIDVAYDATSNSWIALVKGGQAYRSTDGGLTWSLLGASPVENWTSITSSRIVTPGVTYTFYATVEGGKIYGINSSGTTWTVLDPVNRQYTAIATSGGTKPVTFAGVFDGAMYQSIVPQVTVWNPTTIPRNWNAVAVTNTNGKLYAVASVEGGQLYVAEDPYPRLHTFILKYSLAGVPIWANYLNCPSDNEGDNLGTAITCKPSGEIVVGGIYTRELQAFIAGDFETVVKLIPLRGVSGQTTDGYVVSYSADGIPLWASVMVCYSNGVSDPIIPVTSIQSDASGNIYAYGTSSGTQLYNPDGFLQIDNSSIVRCTNIVQYNPDGTVSSCASSNELINIGGRSGSILVNPSGSEMVVCSLHPYTTTIQTVTAYNSLGTNFGLNEDWFMTNHSGIVLFKYALSDADSGPFVPHTYNNPLQPNLLIGGGNRTLSGGYVADETAEVWGGQTGLPPSTITVEDANAGVISYLGHEPGYSIPTTDGLPDFSDANYTHLVVQLSEQSFPTNDPQPVGPGSVPYGFLPIYLNFPSYATGAVFNNALNNSTNLTLSATGTISGAGLLISGIRVGDVLRICAVTQSGTTSRYVTLQVKELVLSDPLTNTQSAIVFEEPTRYLVRALGTNATAETWFLTTKKVPAYYQPVLFDQGQLNVILQLYPETNL